MLSSHWKWRFGDYKAKCAYSATRKARIKRATVCMGDNAMLQFTFLKQGVRLHLSKVNLVLSQQCIDLNVVDNLEKICIEYII